MIKRMTMLVRRSDRSLDAFQEHWLGPHAKIAGAMPQLHRYLQNHLVGRITVAADDPGFNVDGIPELWFVDEAAKTVAFQSDAARMLPVDEKNFIEGITIFAVDEAVLADGAGKAQVLLLVRHPGDGAAMRPWAGRLAKDLAGVRRAVVNTVLSVDSRPGVWHEPSPPNLIVELRFDSETDAEAALSSPAFGAIVASAPGVAIAAHLSDERRIV
jgi:uncharacterized protein (TIGR02118 family)